MIAIGRNYILMRYEMNFVYRYKNHTKKCDRTFLCGFVMCIDGTIGYMRKIDPALGQSI